MTFLEWLLDFISFSIVPDIFNKFFIDCLFIVIGPYSVSKSQKCLISFLSEFPPSVTHSEFEILRTSGPELSASRMRCN